MPFDPAAKLVLHDLAQEERQQQDRCNLGQPIAVKARPRAASQRRKQRCGDKYTEDIEQGRRHHRAGDIAARQRAVSRRRLDRGGQRAKEQEAQCNQRRHPARAELPQHPASGRHHGENPEGQRPEQAMIAKASQNLVPGESQSVEEEQQEHRGIRDELRRFAHSPAYGQQAREQDRGDQQPHHGIDAAHLVSDRRASPVALE